MAIVGDRAMNREQGLQSWPKPKSRPAFSASTVLPVLIQVPAIPATLHRQRWGKSAGGVRNDTRRPGSRPRRRLRREVRLTGYALLCIVALIWLPRMLLLRSESAAVETHSGRGAAHRGRDRAAYATAPAISISIEPTTLAPYADVEPPVVFPGYLLPDDGCEEPAHAGS